MERIIFGPVPSRRLGRSLGINNIPPKTCSYSCIYCQLGRTPKLTVERNFFYEPERIFQQVEEKLQELKDRGEKVDYLTFVPDGEPTLDLNLGRAINLLKKFGLKIAVITNSSLIWQEEVRDDLALADWVSLKIDSLIQKTWKKINRPHGRLSLENIAEGILEFAKIFKGELVTETMLIDGLNDEKKEIETISDFIHDLKPKMSYLSIPTRPPAESWVRPPAESKLNQAYQIFDQKSLAAELLTGYEGNNFTTTDNPGENLLSITSVHPMREEAVNEFLKKAGSSWELVKSLLRTGQLVETEYQGKKFYLRKFR